MGGIDTTNQNDLSISRIAFAFKLLILFLFLFDSPRGFSAYKCFKCSGQPQLKSGIMECNCLVRVSLKIMFAAVTVKENYLHNSMITNHVRHKQCDCKPVSVLSLRFFIFATQVYNFE